MDDFIRVGFENWTPAAMQIAEKQSAQKAKSEPVSLFSISGLMVAVFAGTVAIGEAAQFAQSVNHVIALLTR
jgi:anti-sigma factor RsiW